MTTSAPLPLRSIAATWRRGVCVLAAALLLHLAATPAKAAIHSKPKPVPVPKPRPASVTKANANNHPFQLFIEGLWPEAKARGVSRKTFDLAFKGVTFDPKIVAHTVSQAEFCN